MNLDFNPASEAQVAMTSVIALPAIPCVYLTLESLGWESRVETVPFPFPPAYLFIFVAC